ncbi:hypothetical protein HRG_009242 [Hirsutella rhossiliensis]|uniref:Uncharacterized protein n=1 Tax=Hirsutella rhossiliensis TaxID=111463 RepID=A0A9P8MQM7_9HYPO|nr:uncharacterized protein HRG_09242 [Hirsutella rhossiliensis]KAH0959460.1 hypothetical protein HRG_09242 [Hirsutella rhossiliensis]
MTSAADATMKDMDRVDNLEDAKGRDVDVVMDPIPVPDTDFDLTGISRQCDDVAAENDSFFAKLVDSGAFRLGKPDKIWH